MEKTNAARILDRMKISYELHPYELDDQDLSATHIAEINGFDIKTLYKTLVLKGDKTPLFVAVIPGDATLDLKALAKLSGNKKCELLPTKELLKATGYIRGGCSPIGMKKLFPTYIDLAIENQEAIFVNAGKKGMQMKLNSQDLITAVAAHVAPIAFYEQ